MKECMSFPNPFDDTAFTRQARMGLIKPDGSVNRDAIETLAQVYAALFFENLCDAGTDMEKVTTFCRGLKDQQKTDGSKQALLSICMQYDAMLRPLPEPVWWLVGNDELRAPAQDPRMYSHQLSSECFPRYWGIYLLSFSVPHLLSLFAHFP